MPYASYIAHVGRRTSIRLHRKGTGPATPSREVVLVGESPIVLERETREPLEPRWRHRCELTLLSETHYQFEHIVHDTAPWLVEVTTDGVLLFFGTIETGLYEEQYDSLPYDVRLTATCGLAHLDDYELPFAHLSRNAMGLSSLWDIIKACLSIISHRTLSATAQILSILQGSYVDPDIYRTDGEGRRSYAPCGEILDGILSSLGLMIYSSGTGWILAYNSDLGSVQTIALETEKYPLIESASLQSESAYGSVRIELPTDTGDSYVPILQPKVPVETCTTHTKQLECTLTLPLQRLSATAALAKTAVKATKGEGITIDYIAEEAVAIALPYRMPHGANGLHIELDMGFPGTTFPEDQHDEVQAVVEAYLTDSDWVECMSATYLTPTYVFDATHPRNCRVVPVVPEELRQEPNGKTIIRYQGSPAEGGKSTFTSWRDRFYHLWGGNDELPNQFYQRVKDHLPWSLVRTEDLRDGRLGSFAFDISAPYPQAIEVYERGRQEADSTYTFTPTYLVIYLPMRFWRKHDRDKVSTFTPTKVTIGRVTVSHTWRREPQYDTFIDADRGDGYLRRGDSLTLAYSTLMTGVNLPDALKGLLRDAAGDPLAALPSTSKTNAEIIATQYFALYGSQQDTITLTTETHTPFAPLSVYTLRGRPGHRYTLLGYRWDPHTSECELTLRSAPSTPDATQYAL